MLTQEQHEKVMKWCEWERGWAKNVKTMEGNIFFWVAPDLTVHQALPPQDLNTFEKWVLPKLEFINCGNEPEGFYAQCEVGDYTSAVEGIQTSLSEVCWSAIYVLVIKIEGEHPPVLAPG